MALHECGANVCLLEKLGAVFLGDIAVILRIVSSVPGSDSAQHEF